VAIAMRRKKKKSFEMEKLKNSVKMIGKEEENIGFSRIELEDGLSRSSNF
jgi:hypothetical protein